ncbi:S-formylglutathione hydrolase [Govanella unica]|uniref:S-formylglutathione hydrolase n=1 Tax=Govanella unica TaxID=2975056 RepID=A0A9X3Z802_9PROT|nr:S-formylglutathione hydrolase [Govania unica]MDA5194732.1 S-formylglutathione hydrolase [Govania unica]
MFETLETHMCFGGSLKICRHPSAATGTGMRFSVFTPAGPGPFPVLTFLSGLTCTEENFTVKAGAYKKAAELGLMIVAPDTSPRGDGVANDAAYDLGQGAGFYVDATEAPWAPHFNMYSYITRDLQDILFAQFPGDRKRQGISGHSMGGHGALTLALRNPDLYRSVSAFAPIVSPSTVPWGEKALAAYLGPDQSRWRAHDACCLLADGVGRGAFDDILIDQGSADNFLEPQLQPHLFTQAAAEAGQKVTLRLQEGYDHSYYFISTFMDDHLEFHAQRL